MLIGIELVLFWLANSFQMQRFGNITETVKIELQGMKYCVIQLCGGD
jgi:hypothetical protein